MMKTLSTLGTPRKGRAREILDELVALEGSRLNSPSALSKRRASATRPVVSPVLAVDYTLSAPRKSFKSPAAFLSATDQSSQAVCAAEPELHKNSLSTDGTDGRSCTGASEGVKELHCILEAERDSGLDGQNASKSWKSAGTLHPAKRALWLDDLSDSQRDRDRAIEPQKPVHSASLERSIDGDRISAPDQTVEARNTELASEVLRLRDELANAQKAREASQVSLHELVAASRSKLGMAQDEVALAKQSADSARQETDSARQEADSARAEVDSARGEADSARQEVEVLKRSLEKLQGMVEMDKEAREKQEEGRVRESEVLREELWVEKQGRESVEATCQQLQKELNRLCVDHKNAKQQLQDLQESAQSRVALSNQLSAAQASNMAFQQELCRSEEKLSDLSRGKRELETNMKAIRAENGGLSASNAKLMGKVKSLGLKVDALRAGVSPDVQEHADLEARIVKLQVRKEVLKARVRELENHVSETEDECRDAREKYISLGLKVEELLREEALTQELVLQEKDRGRITLEDQLEQARAAVQALRERNAVLETGLAASEKEIVRQSARANQAASQLQQTLVKLTQLERNDGNGMNGTKLEDETAYAELIELQANEVRKAAGECASAQQKASVLETGFRQLRDLCEDLQREVIRSAQEAEFWRNAAEVAERGRDEAREDAEAAVGKSVRLERVLEDKRLEIRLLESKVVALSATVSLPPDFGRPARELPKKATPN